MQIVNEQASSTAPQWDGSRVLFQVVYLGEQVPCAISRGALEEVGLARYFKPADVLAWMGPAIGPKAYEVGDEVRRAFCAHSAVAAEAFVLGKAQGKWWGDLYMLARQRLEAAGVGSIHGGGFCTYTDEERFFSFRRDGECGRMATLIWLAD